ncbi:alpha/beta hydrolase [Siculibacillus lacustris]|uniref:Alpha/beta hydrolase n=1 Tax=Siculibacillus lacustris TaxID=1549641 RepID=A0A4Q9VJ55_9HYPH|nr:alpha/beta hydrolase [Siculibacillus lacustris]TBW35338.1 alpha/beta hydrolase [Siculibacillus lacustris]
MAQGTGTETAADPLDAEMAAVVAALAAAPAPDPDAPLAVRRRAVDDAARDWVGADTVACPTRDLTVPGGDGEPCRARLHGTLDDDGPVILHLHGGGWTFGSIDSHDDLTRRLAVASGRPVLSLDYRLAPEHPFPAPLDDALAALDFLERGGLGRPIAARRLVVAGDSAGAHLALAALLARRDAGRPALAAGLLFYGCLAPDFETASQRAFGADETFLLSTERMRWYWANLLGAIPAETTGLAAPLRADLAGLPPLFLDAASHDPLRDDTLRLAARLAAIGAPHRLQITGGVVHGYLRFARALAPARATIEAAAAFAATTA